MNYDTSREEDLLKEIATKEIEVRLLFGEIGRKEIESVKLNTEINRLNTEVERLKFMAEYKELHKLVRPYKGVCTCGCILNESYKANYCPDCGAKLIWGKENELPRS